MPPLAGVMYTIGCVVGSFISGLSRCYGAVHDESSLMSAAGVCEGLEMSRCRFDSTHADKKTYINRFI